MFDLILVTTCINHIHVHNLLNSISFNNKSIRAYTIIINQDRIKFIKENNSNNIFNVINLKINNDKFLNSSTARNIALDYILTNNIKSHYICFPDDDTTFDAVFFDELHQIICKGNLKNYIFDVYCQNSKELFHKIKYDEGTLIKKNDYVYVGAVNILIYYDTFIKTGLFDTKFGVNAIYGAGEDGDYFLRVLRNYKFYYTKKIYNFHPSKINSYSNFNYSRHRIKLRNYGKGVIVLLIKHKMFFEAFKVSIRALGGFFYYLYKLMPKVAIIYLEVFFVRLYTLFIFSFKNI